MPVNPILAPFYTKVFYHTSVLKPHVFRLFFSQIPTYHDDTSPTFPTYVDVDHASGWSLLEIIDEVTTRSGFGGSPMPGIVIDTVELWESAEGADIFQGFDPDDYSGVTGGTATPVAAAYWMWVMKASDRSQGRLVFMDAGDSKPQRTAVGTPPEEDDGGLNWFIVNSVVGLVTNDNKRLVDIASVNTGYNRKLARSYGRSIAP